MVAPTDSVTVMKPVHEAEVVMHSQAIGFSKIVATNMAKGWSCVGSMVVDRNGVYMILMTRCSTQPVPVRGK